MDAGKTEEDRVIAKAVRCYERKDYGTAIGLFRQYENNTVARYHIGKHYYYGDGVEQSYDEAFGWMSLAAEGGHARAQNFLAWLYHDGEGTEQSYERAAEWARRSADQDDSYGLATLGYLYKCGEGVEQSYASLCI